MTTIINDAKNYFKFSQSTRRDFHKYPEIGFNEHRSSEIINNELINLGYATRCNVAGTGIIGDLTISNDKPSIMLRFDMDALPINEENDVDYVSQKKGAMHACGHDGHMAVGLTVAKLLADYKSKLKGSIKFCFQPAEEVLLGAKGMIDGGVLKDPVPDYVMGLHIWNEKPKGWVAIVPGPLMSGLDKFTIRIKGKGGHGAIPEQTKDPIIIAAHIINLVQSVISRNVPPVESAVISITQINSGTAFNVIPEQLEMHGSIRTFKEEVRNKILIRLNEIMSGIEAAFECEAKIEVTRLVPPVTNNANLAKKMMAVVKKLYPDFTIDTSYQTMVSEDMAYYIQEIPGCFILLGSANSEKGLIYGQHHPKFDFDEEVLTIGSAILTEATISLINDLI